MNKRRREILSRVADEVEALQEQVVQVREEEEEAVNNIPENLQGTDRYAEMEEGLAAIEEAERLLQDVVEALREMEGI